MDEILVVDDEASVVEVVTLYLKREGFRVRQARTGREALHSLAERKPALVVLDLMLPEVDGLEILRQLRADRTGGVPVIMLTARGQEVDRVYGLEMGADDSRSLDFVARVRGVTGGQREEAMLSYGELEIDPVTHTLTVRGGPVELTATEFNLLWFMMSHPRQVFSRTQLLENVWGFPDYVDPSTVTVHMRRLREKIERDPAGPQYLVTIWGVGYKFEPVASA